MEVGRADEAELERIEPPLGLHPHPVDERLARVAARHESVHADHPGAGPVSADGAVRGEELREQLEVGELVVRRQDRVRLRRALGLRDLHHRLVAQALRRVVGGHRGAREVDQREHLAVADVRVVGDGQRLDAAGALGVQKVPEVLRVVRIQPREREGQVVGAREDDVAVQVALARSHRPLVAGERGELARRVVADRRRDDIGPDGLPEVRVGIGARLHAADVLGVVGHGQEVEGGPELDLDAAHVRTASPLA